MLEVRTFAGLEPGKRLLVFGATHGNEHCGPAAISQIFNDLAEEKYQIERGRVTFLRIANPRAFAARKRYIDHNLNRAVKERSKADLYEFKLMNLQVPLLRSCDYFLNIHSYTAGGAPFAIQGHECEAGFIQSLGVDTVLTNWRGAYAASGHVSNDNDMSQIEFVRANGGIAATIECGQHEDVRAPRVAYQAIRNAMAYCGLTGEQPPLRHHFRQVALRHVHYREPGEEFVEGWQHMQPVREGTPIAKKADGGVIRSTIDGFIIMPHPACPVGEEWFYLGKEENIHGRSAAQRPAHPRQS